MVLIGLLGVSLAVGSGVFAGTASASLSVATADDVVTGLPDATQTVSIAGQAPLDGDADLYTVDVSDVVATGASVSNVTFSNVGDDGDAATSAVEYDAGNRTVSVLVREDPGDRDKKVDFELTLALDTSDAMATDELRYKVSQYDTRAADSSMSPQAAQFTLIGSDLLVARSSSETGGASPVYHNGTLPMPTRERGVTQLVVNTSGANYGGITHENVTVRRNGGPDLVTSAAGDPAVGSDGDGMVIRLDSETNFYDGDEVRVVVEGARNPAQTTDMTLALRRDPSTTVFASSDAIEITPRCLEPERSGLVSATANNPEVGITGMLAGLLGGVGLTRWLL